MALGVFKSVFICL